MQYGQLLADVVSLTLTTLTMNIALRPFSIRIFVPSGNPEGILVASRDDWPGKATIFPRELIGEAKRRREFQQPGVYLLVGRNKGYIGEGDPVGERLERHAKEKEFWHRAVFFTSESGRLNKAHVQHLESRLIRLAKEANRIVLDNGNTPTTPNLSEEEHAFAENFLREILLMLPLLGFWHLDAEDVLPDDEPIDRNTEERGSDAAPSLGKRAALYSKLPRGVQFTLTCDNVTAVLELVAGGVIVKAGSTLIEVPRPRFELSSPTYAAIRRQLTESGVIQINKGRLCFVEDQFFASASAAATVVCGTAKNADQWMSTDGISLGAILRQARKLNC